MAGGSGLGVAYLIRGDAGHERVGVVRRASSAACVAVASTGMTFLSAKTVLARVGHTTHPVPYPLAPSP